MHGVFFLNVVLLMALFGPPNPVPVPTLITRQQIWATTAVVAVMQATRPMTLARPMAAMRRVAIAVVAAGEAAVVVLVADVVEEVVMKAVVVVDAVEVAAAMAAAVVAMEVVVSVAVAVEVAAVVHLGTRSSPTIRSLSRACPWTPPRRTLPSSLALLASSRWTRRRGRLGYSCTRIETPVTPKARPLSPMMTLMQPRVPSSGSTARILTAS